MKPLLLSHYTATSCLGRGLQQTLAALLAEESGLDPCDFETVALQTYIGEVADVDAVRLPDHLAEFDCRNNRLAQLALEQDDFSAAVAAAALKYGKDRVGIFIGTSTSGILQTELAYRCRDAATGALPEDFHYSGTHNPFSVTDFTRRYLNVTGPAVTLSSACSSSAKVFGSAQRMIAAGLIDAAVVGGVDSLCLTVLYGFHSLGLTSQHPCRPFDAQRDGISIGEAAAFVLLDSADVVQEDNVLLLGVGESSDAYHMSSPHPQGAGARLAMQAALDSAGLQARDIDYINLHGTATLSNDTAEGLAVNGLFGADVPCSSTKGATGHTLGAAGSLEAVICALALTHGLLPGGRHFDQLDADMALNYLSANRFGALSRVMSNSFGFGGTNCSLVFGRAPTI